MQIDMAKLQGQHVYLETLQPEHTGILKSLARDARLWEYTKTLLVNETFDEQFERYMQAAFDERATGGQHSFVIRQTTDNTIIGMTRFYKIEPAHKRLSIGFTWYVPGVWGQVHNKECKLLLLQYAFEEAQFQRVEFEVAHQNIRSQKAVLKIGGVPEGRLRKHGLHADGTVRDTIVFSIIDDEWTEKKTALLKLVQE
jgi:RimJ/RimL family protein N-acetyltransferase